MLFQAFQNNPAYALMYVMVIVFSICCHEYAHARVALWQGDDTAKQLGHLTLNPLKQMGVVSLIMLVMIGMAFGQVPVNRARLRRPYGEAIVSFAGPFANLVLFFSSVVCAVFAAVAGVSPAFEMFRVGARLNFVLFVLNMMPVPPLDGYGIMTSFFPEIRYRSSEFINGATFLVFMVLIFSAGYLFRLGEFTSDYMIESFYGIIEGMF